MTSDDRYFIDFPARIRAIQSAMAEQNIDVYLGSRLRTLSWTLDAFAPWRSFVVIPADGLPTAFTFVIDAARLEDDSWLDEDHVMVVGMDFALHVSLPSFFRSFVLSRSCYQLDFRMPGSWPARASSRRAMREIPNLR